MPNNKICLAKITSAHGIKGEVKIATFTEFPENILDYGPLYNEDGDKKFEITIRSVISNNCVIAKIEGVSNRNDAEYIGNTELFVDRDKLPQIDDEDEFYIEDLKDLDVKLTQNTKVIYGKVLDIYNFGAGDILEILVKETNKKEMFAFNKVNFPIINIEKNFLIFNKPEEEFVDKS